MKNLLFLGGTSFFGKCAVEKLIVTNNFDLKLLTRGKNIPAEFQDHVNFITCDRSDRKALMSALKNQYFDIVVDNIARNGLDVKNILELLQGSVEHYLLCSTAAVYPQWHTSHVWLEPEAINEPVPGQSPYVNGKRDAERQLRNSHVPYTIYRPAVVEGPGDPMKRTKYFVDKIYHQQPFYIPDDVLLQHVYSQDVAATIVKLIALGATQVAYNICGDDQISIQQYCDAIAEVLGKKPCYTLVARPQFIASYAEGFPFLYDNSLLLSNSFLKEKTHFKPTSIAQWLLPTIRSMI